MNLVNQKSGLVYRVEGIIPDAVFLLVAIVAAGSFILSYFNLMVAATNAGIPGFLTPAFPIVVDSFLLIGTLTVLRNSLINESTRKGWVVLVIFTFISICLNVSVGETTLISYACHSLPPLALAISLDLFTGFIRSDLTRSVSIPITSEELIVHQDVQPDPDPVREQILEPEDYTPARSQVSDEDIIRVYRESPGATYSELGEMVGMSKSGVYGRISSLRKRGLIDQDVIPDYYVSKEIGEPVQPA